MTDLQLIAAHYQQYRPRWRLKDTETKLIRQQLKQGYTVEDMCLAIDALFADEFCAGKNDRGKKYQRLGLAIDDKHIDDRIEEGEKLAKIKAYRQKQQQASEVDRFSTNGNSRQMYKEARNAENN